MKIIGKQVTFIIDFGKVAEKVLFVGAMLVVTIKKIKARLFCFIMLNCLSTVIWATSTFAPMETNQTFRDEVIDYVNTIAKNRKDSASLFKINEIDSKWRNHYQRSDWTVEITAFYRGGIAGVGRARGASLSAVLEEATKLSLLQQPIDYLLRDEVADYRFAVAFDYYPSARYAMIEYKDKGLELSGSRVTVRRLTTDLVRNQLRESQNYLLKAMHPVLHGFYKVYDAYWDKEENLLRVVYSASSLMTLMNLYQFNKDPELELLFKPIADFILSNQIQEGSQAGAFYYGYDPTTKKRIHTAVVGTAAKTIFTLLELNHFYPNEPKYLVSAKKAGDWLLTRIAQDGRVSPIATETQGHWQDEDKQSLLYSGQVLSALSRLYKETHDARYYEGATKIAKQFLQLVDDQGPILGDKYRPANSISSSWVMMSLIDYAKTNKNPITFNTIERVAQAILVKQITRRDDIFNNGRYLDVMTSSGNGWINEVMANMYDFCKKNSLSNCHNYRDAIILNSRWLIQNAYSLENTYNVRNPEKAIGGLITHFSSPTARTDAVCHAVNSFIALLNFNGLGNQLLFYLPERPLVEILPLLRAGKGV